MKTIQIHKLDPNAKIPTRTYKTDAGLDLYALEDTIIAVGETRLVKTGVAIQVPEGYVGMIKSRSSLGIKGLQVGAGVVDTDYAGDLSIVVHNFSATEKVTIDTELPRYIFKAGDKIAQLVLLKIETPEPMETKVLWDSERGSKGFGHSGR
jgi:dUTP pyrophosphatase